MFKKRIATIMIGILLISLGCGMVYASTTLDIVNSFVTGVVDITLTEYQKVGNEEKLFENYQIIVPGDVISQIPRIHNEGNDCYVRAKITFREASDIVNESDLFGIGPNWVKAKDGYYYYTEVVPHDGSVDLFQGIKIPTSVTNKDRDLFYIDLKIDAIQSQSFTPDYDADEPWGSVEIIKCESSGNYEINTFKPSETTSFKIEYQGGSAGFITNSKDFFANIPSLMPGDIYEDSFEFVNSSETPVTLYFRSATYGASETADKINLKIFTKNQNGEKVIYNGSLNGVDIENNVTVCEIQAKTTERIYFEISVPADLTNEYSMASSSIKWVFSTKPITNMDIPKTGDSANVQLWTILVGISGLVLVAVGVMTIASQWQEKKQ